jgi:hypothetical protein
MRDDWLDELAGKAASENDGAQKDQRTTELELKRLSILRRKENAARTNMAIWCGVCKGLATLYFGSGPTATASSQDLTIDCKTCDRHGIRLRRPERRWRALLSGRDKNSASGDRGQVEASSNPDNTEM